MLNYVIKADGYGMLLGRGFPKLGARVSAFGARVSKTWGEGMKPLPRAKIGANGCETAGERLIFRAECLDLGERRRNFGARVCF